MNPKTVVVAEDSPTQALDLENLLSQAGLQVICVPNGVECLRMVEQMTLKPALILLDLEMPGMNGLQTCQSLKEMPATAEIPVILLSRHDDPEVALLGLQTGAYDYIAKDAFINATLLETIWRLGLISTGG